MRVVNEGVNEGVHEGVNEGINEGVHEGGEEVGTLYKKCILFLNFCKKVTLFSTSTSVDIILRVLSKGSSLVTLP